MHVDLLAAQRELKADVSSLELATTGGAPCPPKLFKDIKSVFGLRAVTVTKLLLFFLNKTKFEYYC